MLDLVSQATLLVDQSRSNLAVVTTLFTQLSIMSSSSVPAINEVLSLLFHLYLNVLCIHSLPDHHRTSSSVELYPNLAINCPGKQWLKVMHIYLLYIVMISQLLTFHRIVRLFEVFTSRQVQQQNLTSQISVSHNLMSLFTQKVCVPND